MKGGRAEETQTDRYAEENRLWKKSTNGNRSNDKNRW